MIKDLFEENKIHYQMVNVPNQLTDLQLEKNIVEYLSCMGKDLYLYVSDYGVALTSLLNRKSL